MRIPKNKRLFSWKIHLKIAELVKYRVGGGKMCIEYPNTSLLTTFPVKSVVLTCTIVFGDRTHADYYVFEVLRKIVIFFIHYI